MGVIQLEQVTKTYSNGVVALQPTTLTIQPGTFTAILGPSGAGKSTLLRLMNGLETPTSGKVIFLGIPLHSKNLRWARSRIAMVFQQFNLVGRLNVMTNVLTGRLYHCPQWASLFYWFSKQDLEIAHWSLARVGLVDKAWDRADQLSGGQQQRVAVARALAQKPEVILADEPVASLDPVASEVVMDLLLEICRQDGMTIIASLHQVALAARYADRIIGLNQGRVVFDDSPVNLIQDALYTIYRREDGSVDESLAMALAN